MPSLYLPFSMVIEDRRASADFDTRLPVLTDGTDLG